MWADFPSRPQEDAMPPPPASIWDYFSELPDPRRAQGRRHKLIDILAISLCAMLCGADDFIEIEEFGETREAWLRQFLELPHGIPSHDTFGRVFAALDPKAFGRCFMSWVRGVAELSEGAIVSIDGKAVRRSYDAASGCAAIELVSAWARGNRLTLGQVKVAEGSNEITAVPELLKVLALKGCVVTADALNCQKEIAAEIRRQGADYVLALKGNHATLHERVMQFLASVREGRTHGFAVGEQRSVEKGHGRIEERRFWQVNAPEELAAAGEWAGLASVGLCEAVREVEGHVSTHRRYYLSSLPVEAAKFAEAVRGHWAVENSCHWVLDVAFGEDGSRVRAGHAAENFALLRRLVNNLLQHERSVKRGVKAKRLKAALDEQYLLKVLRI
jgi:predicted transposase YbfD/YdcC